MSFWLESKTATRIYTFQSQGGLGGDGGRKNAAAEGGGEPCTASNGVGGVKETSSITPKGSRVLCNGIRGKKGTFTYTMVKKYLRRGKGLGHPKLWGALIIPCPIGGPTNGLKKA